MAFSFPLQEGEELYKITRNWVVTKKPGNLEGIPFDFNVYHYTEGTWDFD